MVVCAVVLHCTNKIIIIIIIGPLKDKNCKIVEDAEGMTQILNKYFASVFTRENLDNIPEIEPLGETSLCDIEINKERVAKAIN